MVLHAPCMSEHACRAPSAHAHGVPSRCVLAASVPVSLLQACLCPCCKRACAYLPAVSLLQARAAPPPPAVAAAPRPGTPLCPLPPAWAVA
eukprot:2056790-Alexandrium_andersonii.AAC.1